MFACLCVYSSLLNFLWIFFLNFFCGLYHACLAQIVCTLFGAHAAGCVCCGLKCFNKISKKKPWTGILFLFFSQYPFHIKIWQNDVDLKLFSSFLYLFLFFCYEFKQFMFILLSGDHKLKQKKSLKSVREICYSVSFVVQIQQIAVFSCVGVHITFLSLMYTSTWLYILALFYFDCIHRTKYFLSV